MSVSEKLRNFSNSVLGRNCSALILAGGSGSRFANCSSLPKQFAKICGIPMIIYSVKAFDESSLINEIIIVSRNEDISYTEEILSDYTFKKPIKVVEGGKTRQESALCGFIAADKKASFIAVHDAARPLITCEAIDAVISEAFHFKAAIAAAKATDTPKIVSPSHIIKEKAPEREKLWLAQTPQVFESDLYRTASYYAIDKGFKATDDASLIEHAGFYVKAVETKITNIKVTLPDDLIIADAIINSRKTKNENSKRQDK